MLIKNIKNFRFIWFLRIKNFLFIFVNFAFYSYLRKNSLTNIYCGYFVNSYILKKLKEKFNFTYAFQCHPLGIHLFSF